MKEFLDHINSLSPISKEASEEIVTYIKTKNYEKGEMIHEAGNICRNLYFIKSGLVKHFNYYKGNQFVLRFFEENQFFIATDSFFYNRPAEYSTVALEDTTLHYLLYEDFERLCENHHSFESYARKFASIVAYTAISNLKGLLYMDATARYAKFIKEYGHLQQRISLGDTAGYLGISQVSLSRIRSKK